MPSLTQAAVDRAVAVHKLVQAMWLHVAALVLIRLLQQTVDTTCFGTSVTSTLLLAVRNGEAFRSLVACM